MTPSEIGERTEAAILAALAASGKHVLLPFGGHHRYDLAFEESRGRLVKVQCKSAYVAKGALIFKTCSYVLGSPRDYRDEVDLFGIYCHDRSEVYFVPVGDVPTSRASLRLDPARNGQSAGIRMASTYLFREGHLPDSLRDSS
jgi:hypothetical protein